MLLNLFKPPTFNKYNINLTYKYWRIRIFYSLFIGYIFFYFTRKSFIFIIPLLIEDLHLSINDLGIISTLFYITYACSKLISSILSDKSNPRYFMSIGLILTGFFNICIGLSSYIYLFIIFWTLNAFFQGWGWPPIAKQLTYWYSNKERGLWWGLCSVSHNIGGAIIPLLIGYLSVKWGWRYSMYIIGIICIIMGVFLINRLRDTPQTLGLPPIEIYKNDLSIKNKSYIKFISISQNLLYNKTIWLLGISYFFIYIIRTAINDWSILYLVNQKGYNLLSAGGSIFCFELGGLIGTITAGWVTDNIFNGKRIAFIIISTLGLTIIIILFWNVPTGFKSIDYTLIGAIGFLTFGPQMLIGLTASETVNKKSTCTANGIVGCCAYIGAALTGYPLSLIINLSWDIYFILIITSAIIVICPMLLILYNITNKKTVS